MKRVTNLIYVNNNSACKRSMSMLHAGRFCKKVPTQATNTSGFHKGVTITTCKQSECVQKNCADSNNSGKCPYTTSSQIQNLPAPNPDAEFKTTVVGNLTSKVPHDKKGFVVDASLNYNNQPKSQQMVVEPVPVTIETKDFVVDPNVTKYVQDPQHYQAIVSHINTR